MASAGQRFELDLDSDDFTINLHNDDGNDLPGFAVKEIQEHEDSVPPPPPSLKASKSGFPTHNRRARTSRFQQQQQQQQQQQHQKSGNGVAQMIPAVNVSSSDRVAKRSVAQEHGRHQKPAVHDDDDDDSNSNISNNKNYNMEAQQKAEISKENDKRLAEMSEEEIAAARAELLGALSPDLLERLLKRANIDQDSITQDAPRPARRDPSSGNHPQNKSHDKSSDGDGDGDTKQKHDSNDDNGNRNDDDYNSNDDDDDDDDTAAHPLSDGQYPLSSNVHFPTPKDPAAYTPLDPDSPSFLTDLHATYFPSLPHNPSSLSWMTEGAVDGNGNGNGNGDDDGETSSSPYSPSLASLPASALRFSFTGRLITPRESLAIPVTEGLHHHGQAPSSAGYTVPELTLLARSAMPNQRCVAYQTVGRLLYRLGKGEFAGGPNGSELEDAIWDVIERERILELVLAEAGKSSGHLSARKYATEALWLWRRGGGDAPERGLRKPQHRSDMQSIQEEA